MFKSIHLFLSNCKICAHSCHSFNLICVGNRLLKARKKKLIWKSFFRDKTVPRFALTPFMTSSSSLSVQSQLIFLLTSIDWMDSLSVFLLFLEKCSTFSTFCVYGCTKKTSYQKKELCPNISRFLLSQSDYKSNLNNLPIFGFYSNCLLQAQNHFQLVLD